MKEVIYFLKGEDRSYLLTDQEFIEAKCAWDVKNSYWCHRLEKLMPPTYRMVGTPEEDIGFCKISIDCKNGQKIYLRGDKYYTKVFENGTGRLVHVNEQYVNKERLVNQENYYQEKKYLT